MSVEYDNLASTHTTNLHLLVDRRYNKDKVVVVDLYPCDVSSLATYEETTKRSNRPFKLDSQPVGNIL